MPHLYAVSKGLAQGDKIIIEGIRKVNENDKIKFTFVQPKKVISNLKLYAE